MSVSAKQSINSLRQATADGEITPSRLATVLDQIHSECFQSGGITELPDYLSEQKIEAIGSTATSALKKANEAVNSIEQMGGCGEVESEDVDSMITELFGMKPSPFAD